MISPTFLMLVGAVVFLVGLVVGLINIIRLFADSLFHAFIRSGPTEKSVLKTFIVHTVCYVFCLSGAISFITGLVMFLINYFKR